MNSESNTVVISVALPAALAQLLDEEVHRRQRSNGPARRATRTSTVRELLSDILQPLPAPVRVRERVRRPYLETSVAP
jgi:hypothetical protein